MLNTDSGNPEKVFKKNQNGRSLFYGYTITNLENMIGAYESYQESHEAGIERVKLVLILSLESFKYIEKRLGYADSGRAVETKAKAEEILKEHGLASCLDLDHKQMRVCYSELINDSAQ